MPYYRPIKTIASVAGLPGGGSGSGSIVIVSNVEPTTRDDGSNLREGDFWFQPNTELTYIYAVGEWQVIGSNVDYGGDFIIDGGNSLGNGFINNNPGDGTGSGGGGVTDTSDLPLSFAGLNPFDNLKITDLPSTDNLNFQSDANTWYLEAIIALHGDVELIEKDIENLNNAGAAIEFKAKAPITVQTANKVVQHGFNIQLLNPIN